MLVLMPHTDSHMGFAKDEKIQADGFHENKNAGPPPIIFWMLIIEITPSEEEEKNHKWLGKETHLSMQLLPWTGHGIDSYICISLTPCFLTTAYFRLAIKQPSHSRDEPMCFFYQLGLKRTKHCIHSGIIHCRALWSEFAVAADKQEELPEN